MDITVEEIQPDEVSEEVRRIVVTGGVALPSVYHFDRTRGFQPRDRVVDREPETSNPVSSTQSSAGSNSPNKVAGETGSPSL